MWGTLFGRGSVDVEAMADRFTDMVLGPLLPDGRAHSPLVNSTVRNHVGQMLDEVRVRLDQIEQTMIVPPNSAAQAAGSPPTRSRKKPKS
jgi:hypothetical protein